jgi:DNA-binding NtrC family response regulator
VERREARILIVDDEPMMSDSLKQNLAEEGYIVDTAATGAEAIAVFDTTHHQLVICDLQLPDMDGMDVLRHIKDAHPSTEVIVITGYGTVARAVEATKAGAFYFVEKPFDFEQIEPLVEKAIERRELVAETENMRRQLSTRTEYFNIIGGSKPMQLIYETIEAVAKSDANVLIVGESGTGKELIANAIHYNSLRARKPFIKVNCAALPKELIESELFGHTKGAFTGAHADKDGLVQHAAGGSLLLDEIAEMPVELQPKLLRVLQERSYRKVGSERTYPADFVSSPQRIARPPTRFATECCATICFTASRPSRFTFRPCASAPKTSKSSPNTSSNTTHANTRAKSTASRKRLTGDSSRTAGPATSANSKTCSNAACCSLKATNSNPVDLPFENGGAGGGGASGAVAQGGGWDVPPNMTLEDIEKIVIERTLQRTGGNKQAAANL